VKICYQKQVSFLNLILDTISYHRYGIHAYTDILPILPSICECLALHQAANLLVSLDVHNQYEYNIASEEKEQHVRPNSRYLMETPTYFYQLFWLYTTEDAYQVAIVALDQSYTPCTALFAIQPPMRPSVKPNQSPFSQLSQTLSPMSSPKPGWTSFIHNPLMCPSRSPRACPSSLFLMSHLLCPVSTYHEAV